jgi:hypothetical protein
MRAVESGVGDIAVPRGKARAKADWLRVAYVRCEVEYHDSDVVVGVR